jgi:hypothetical protein
MSSKLDIMVLYDLQFLLRSHGTIVIYTPLALQFSHLGVTPKKRMQLRYYAV